MRKKLISNKTYSNGFIFLVSLRILVKNLAHTSASKNASKITPCIIVHSLNGGGLWEEVNGSHVKDA